MQVECRNCGAFQNNRLESDSLLPQKRFADVERVETVSRVEHLPDVRPTVIARGKLLISDHNYPGAEIVRYMACLLAQKLRL